MPGIAVTGCSKDLGRFFWGLDLNITVSSDSLRCNLATQRDLNLMAQRYSTGCRSGKCETQSMVSIP